jgi:hypothetical protein
MGHYFRGTLSLDAAGSMLFLWCLTRISAWLSLACASLANAGHHLTTDHVSREAGFGLLALHFAFAIIATPQIVSTSRVAGNSG